MQRKLIIGVIGASRATAQGLAHAEELGRLIAARGVVLVCGGLGGIMEAACRGCREAGGETIGVLPGDRVEDANPWVSLPVVTDMGHARNIIIAQTARALIAVEGEYGTLSEIAIALKLGRPVATLGGWPEIPGLLGAESPQQALDLVLARTGV